MGGNVAGHDAIAALDERHAIVGEDLLDLVLGALERVVELVFQHDVGLAHDHGEIEFEPRFVIHEVDRLNGELLALHGLEPTGKRAPDRG